MSAAAAREVARREKARLRELAKQKKENLERLREQQNQAGQMDQVRAAPSRSCCSPPFVRFSKPLIHRLRATTTPSTPEPDPQENRGKARLKFLLQQAEIFQHFAPESVNKDQAKKKKKWGPITPSPTHQPPSVLFTLKSLRIIAFVPLPSECFALLCSVLYLRRGRSSSKFTEEQEDSELLKDEEEDLAAQQHHRLTVQPSCISHGTMREYQMQGLNWLIHLYDNGINGILADEMVSNPHYSPFLELIPPL